MHACADLLFFFARRRGGRRRCFVADSAPATDLARRANGLGLRRELDDAGVFEGVLELADLELDLCE